MAPSTTNRRLASCFEEEDDDDNDGEDVECDVRKRMSRLSVVEDSEGGSDADSEPSDAEDDSEEGADKIGAIKTAAVVDDAKFPEIGGDVVDGGQAPPPRAMQELHDEPRKDYASEPEEQWLRLLRSGGGGGGAQKPRRRSSFSCVRRERAAREAWLDRAWQMKKSWHERNGVPDANGTPQVVVMAAASPRKGATSPLAGGSGVAMDMEEVRACRDLGLELPSDCTVEIPCYGLSAGGTDTVSRADDNSPSAGSWPISNPGDDPMDVKARLKVWAQAVALASATHIGS